MDRDGSKRYLLEHMLDDPQAKATDLPLYLLEDITNNFCDEYRIGKGGFAVVYRGVLRNGIVAVKKLTERIETVDEKYFIGEAENLMNVHHKNIVRLLGYCNNVVKKFLEHDGKRVVVEDQQRLLCFEFLPKGSLRDYITSADDDEGLEWKTRYQIVKGICEGLHHLHSKKILHLDLKPENILLNDDMEPKIADFGLSKLFDEEKIRTTTMVTGSAGYMAPERFRRTKKSTFKLDIYSLGVIILEILTGERGHTPVDEVLESWKTRFKPSEGDTWLELEQIEVCAKIGIECIDPNPQKRPVVRHIIETLKKTEHSSSTINVSSPMEKRGSPKGTPTVSGQTSSTSSTFQDLDVTRISQNAKDLEEEKAQRSLNENHQDVTRISLNPKDLEEEKARRSLNENQQDVSHISLNPKDLEEGKAQRSLNENQQDLEEQKAQKPLNENQQEYQDLLIKCVSQDLGFSNGKPVAACLIYRCLLHWRLFEVERTVVYDRIIQTIGSAIESQDNNDKLAYWLSNSSILLLLLQRTLKTTGAAGLTPQRRRSSAAFFGIASFGRVFSGVRASPQSDGRAFLGSRLIGGLGDLRQVEAKYPALLFKQQLVAFLEKIYRMIRDELMKEMSPLLARCIQAPRTSRSSLIKGSRSQANALAQQTLIAHWQNIVKTLTNCLNDLQANCVPSFLICKVFNQIFSFINVQLFNSLLLRRECCSLSNGEYVKAGLAELEQWCIYATEEYAGSSWEELKHIRQAVGFLVIHRKGNKTLKEITNDLCPVLSIQQLYRISTMYWDDKYGTHTVSSDVISSMKVMMTEDSIHEGISSFLLDDDSSIPFTVDDISKSMTEIKVTDIVMPPLIQQNSAFTFLHQRKD